MTMAKTSIGGWAHISTRKDLLDDRYRYAVLLSICVNALQQFSGINAVVYYSGEIFKSFGFSDKNALLMRFVGKEIPF
jgi:hypothetical protein